MVPAQPWIAWCNYAKRNAKNYAKHYHMPHH